MQDSKERPPPSLPDDIVKISKYKISSDANPREIFWAVVESYKEGKGFGEMVKKYAGIREALVNIGCSVLREPPGAHRIKIAKTSIAKCLFSMVVKGGWGDVLERMLSNLYERKKGPDLNMLMAFGDGFAGSSELVGEWLKALLSDERPSEPVLAYVTELGDAKMVEALRAELLNIARTEINEPQVYAMDSLSALLPGDAEVGKLFVDMMDDWDLETKKVALETMEMHEFPDAGKKAVSMYAYEADEAFRIALEQIIEKNKGACEGEFTKMMAVARGKEMEGLGALARKIYGKKKARGLIPPDLPPGIKKEAEASVE